MDSASLRNPLQLSNTAIILLAGNLATGPHLPSLAALIGGYPHVLHFSLVLEILLKVLPETTSPEEYLPIVYRLYRNEPDSTGDISVIPATFIQKVSNLSEQAARRKLAMFQLHAQPLDDSVAGNSSEEVLSRWFFDRARRVEEATGMIDLARRLVCPETTNFQQTPPFPPEKVVKWGKGVVQVLETFIFDSDDEDELHLVVFENLDPDSAVRLLLSRTTAETVSTNLRRLVLPFIEYSHSKEPEQNLWETVWDWLLDKSVAGELQYISIIANNWINSTETVLKEFLRICLAACYLCRQTSPSIRSYLRRIHEGLSHLSNQLELPQSTGTIPQEHAQTDLLATELRISSPLTNVTREAFEFLEQMIKSADIVAQYSISPELSLSEIILIRGGNEQGQEQLLDRLLRSEQHWKSRNETQWKQLRSSMKWLQRTSRVLGKLSEEFVDRTILTAILDSTGIHDSAAGLMVAFALAREIFVRGHALPSEVIEKTVLEAFYRFYDNATNGNRTRGGMKNAFQSLQVLDDPSALASTAHAVKLVSATHNLSHYSLSLTPGTAITPAQIRMNKDPAFLVCKVIEKNSSIYREMDRMIKILDDLIEGTQLFKESPTRELEISRMHARVYAVIVKAALNENDFTTAFNTCMGKLSPLSSKYVDDTIYDVAWRAYDLVGSYSSYAMRDSSHTDFQKMELLALAVLICPKSEIVEILRKWTELERKSLSEGDSSALHTSAEDNRSLLTTAAQAGWSIARTASPLLGDGVGNGMERTDEGRGTTSRFGVRDTVKTGLTQGIGWLLGDV